MKKLTKKQRDAIDALDPTNRTRKYILNAKGEPVECKKLSVWGEFFETSKLRQVGDDTIDGVRVSTIFLGLDHNFGGGPPILWETMVFAKGRHDGAAWHQKMDRCSGNREQAEAMHARMVRKVKRMLKLGGKKK